MKREILQEKLNNLIMDIDEACRTISIGLGKGKRGKDLDTKSHWRMRLSWLANKIYDVDGYIVPDKYLPAKKVIDKVKNNEELNDNEISGELI